MVNRKRNYTLHFFLMAVLVTVALGAFNYLAMEYRARLDLTADQRFTLSDGTQRLFEKLTDPITVTYYVDEEPPAKRINLERDVRDKLEELAVSSAGKLQYRVERISNDQLAEKRKELQDKGIETTVDVLTSGSDERTEMRGVQGYFSSLEIRYGTNEPKVINGVVNLVDKADEAREHRVDTLEFDIAYTVLTMRGETRKPGFERMLRLLDGPLQMALFVTGEMPDKFKATKTSVDGGVTSLVGTGGGRIEFVRREITSDTGREIFQANPFMAGDDNRFQIAPFGQGGRVVQISTPQGQMLAPSEIYTACVYLRFKVQGETKEIMIGDFTEQADAAAVSKRIEDIIWETFRPRTRLGFILPPADPRMQDPRNPPEPGQPPRNAYSPLWNYIKNAFEYETVWVDLQGQKRVPRDLACLVVTEPNRLSERELFEIERYLNEGGNVVMLVQGWSADLDFSMFPVPPVSVSLRKEPMEPAFEEWARHLGIEFGQDLLLRPNGKLQPYIFRQDRRGQQLEMVPGPVRLAPLIEPGDLNATSVFTRGLAAMPLPLVIESKIDTERLSSLGLEQTELISLKDDIYRFMPANPVAPEVPLNFNLNSAAEVERDPAATPGKGILAQRLDRDARVATLLSGKFPSFWVDQKRKVPGWNGDPEEQDAQPVLNPREGRLLVMTTAATLNINYLYGYPQQEIEPVVIGRGITFYRNLAEAFIYGDDLVSLRARTGVAPRIVGPVDPGTRTMWFMICIAGMPLLLLAAAGVRSFARTRAREEYEIALGIRDADK
jgi:hypothetical protein